MSENRKKNLFSYMSKPILIITLILAVGGAFLILDASSISAVLKYKVGTPYYFFLRQLLWIGIGLIGSVFILIVPTKYYRRLSGLISISLIGVIFVIICASSTLGDIRTVAINIGGSTIQPAEFLKIALVMYMGAFYGDWVNEENHKQKWKMYIPLVLCGISCVLVAFGGDVGTASIMVALFALTFMCIPSSQHEFVTLKRIAVAGFIIGFLVLKFGYLVFPKSMMTGTGRLARFNYPNPCDNYLDNGYQVCNGYIAMDNGGVKGVGLGKSTQKYLYLVESHTDFIFPILVEEFGMLAGVGVIVVYALLILFMFRISVHTCKLSNSIIAYGLSMLFMLHVFINLSGVLGIFPVTGVPLPFLSYGGTFCLSMFVCFALIQRINIENKLNKQ